VRCAQGPFNFEQVRGQRFVTRRQYRFCSRAHPIKKFFKCRGRTRELGPFVMHRQSLADQSMDSSGSNHYCICDPVAAPPSLGRQCLGAKRRRRPTRGRRQGDTGRRIPDDCHRVRRREPDEVNIARKFDDLAQPSSERFLRPRPVSDLPRRNLLRV
jgi:hypothetical protein